MADFHRLCHRQWRMILAQGAEGEIEIEIERERECNMNIFFHDSSIDLNIAGKLDVAFRGAACSYGKDIA